MIDNENLRRKVDNLNASNDDLAAQLDIEKQKTDKLSKENTDFHNEVAAYQQEIETLEQKLKDAEDVSKSNVKDLEQSKSDSTRQITEADDARLLAQSELEKIKAQLEQEAQKRKDLQNYVDSLLNDLEEKEAEFRELRDVSDANEAGLRAAEQESIENEVELVTLRQDSADLERINQGVQALFEVRNADNPATCDSMLTGHTGLGQRPDPRQHHRLHRRTPRSRPSKSILQPQPPLRFQARRLTRQGWSSQDLCV